MSNHRTQCHPIYALGAASALAMGLAGPLAARSFDSVVVEGAEFITDESIIASCEISTGVEYSSADLAYMRECLMSSGEFHSVKLAAIDRRLTIKVAEINDRPGRVELGVAYDSRDGLVGNVYFERYNLFPGTFGALELKMAEEVQSFESNLYRKGAFGPFDFGIDMLMRRTDFDEQGFTGTRVLLAPYLAYPFANDGRLELALGYRKDKMADVAQDASALFQSEAGAVDAPYSRLGLSYGESFDEGRLAGYALRVDHYFWGLGDAQRTDETRVEVDASYRLADAWSVVLGGQIGFASAKGDKSTRAMDRFFVGGADFRGFGPRGIGPKDGRQFVGANKFYVASVEVQRELGEVLGTTGRVGVFADVGSAWSLENLAGSHGVIDDSRKLRSAVGIALTLDVGDVPVSAYVAKAVDKVEGDDTQSFGISFSTSF